MNKYDRLLVASRVLASIIQEHNCNMLIDDTQRQITVDGCAKLALEFADALMAEAERTQEEKTN